MSFDEWYSINEDKVQDFFDQVGLSRELDFDSEVEFDKMYELYLESE